MRSLRSLIIILIGALSSCHQDNEYKVLETQTKLIEGTLMVNGAAGVMVYWDKEEKTGYILTAYHVIEHNLVHGAPTNIRWRHWPDRAVHHYTAEIHDFDEDNDLALLTVGFEYSVLQVMSTKEYNKLKPKRLIMSAGYPFNINSIFVGVGPLRDPHFTVPKCPDSEQCHLNYLEGRHIFLTITE